MVLLLAYGQAGQDPSAPPATTQEGAPTPAPPSTRAPATETPPPERQGREGRQGRESKRRRADVPQTAVRTGRLPTRTTRSAGLVTQTLVLDVNLQGGYDDNLSAGTASGFENPTAMASGSAGTFDAGFTFARHNLRHALTLNSRGTAYAYPAHLAGPVVGADAALGGQTTLGRNTTLDGSQMVGYEPFFSPFDTTGTMPSAQLEQAVPSTGLFERRSIVGRSALSITQQWGVRQSATGRYEYGSRRFADAAVGDTRVHSANAAYRVTVSGALAVRGDYRYMNFAATEPGGGVRPNRTHRIEGGLQGDVPTSRTQKVSWSVVGGANKLSSEGSTLAQPFVSWVPVGSATMKLPVSDTWAVDASYLREFSLLQGLTDAVYANDTAMLTLGGLAGRRTNLQIGGSFATWRTPAPSGIASTFKVYGFTLQVRHALTRTVGMIASYSYYHHRFADGGELPEGFPTQYDRNALRMGVSVRFPLAGRSAAPQPLGGR